MGNYNPLFYVHVIDYPLHQLDSGWATLVIKEDPGDEIVRTLDNR